MKKIYIFYLSFILTILISTLALSQTTVFYDNFDTYTVGQQIACQSGGVWKTWSNLPCNLTEDALVSSNYSFSGANSVVIKDSNDIVRENGTPISTGIAEINFQVFIPTGKSGYFNTLANFAPPTYVWAMQVFFNSPGTGKLDAAGANAATFSYPQNQWFNIKIIADLVKDSAQFWIDGLLIHKWQYSKGTFGTSTITKQLDGNDFFGYTINDEMYIDDYTILNTPIATNKISSTPTGGNWDSGSSWVGGSIPASNIDVEIVAGASVILSSNTNRTARTIVNGNLICGNFNISGSGNFILGANATLQIGSASGISSSGAIGNIQVTGSRTFNQFANYVYNGSSAQVTGNGLPSSIKNLTINNSAGVSLSSNILVSGTLNLITGNLITNSNSLSLGTSITNLGTLLISTGRVVGNFNRWISNSSSILFPVGTSSSKYTPVTLSNVVGNGTFSVVAVPGIHPTILNPNFLQMYWKLTNGGVTSADITFNYLDVDVVGDENLYSLFKYDGNWLPYSPINLNTTANTVNITGVSSFSDWTLGIDHPLPVELKSFSATIIGSTVKLNWNTATEVNNYGFEIERAVISNVERNLSWEKIGFLSGNGNSNSPKSYSFMDDKVSVGKYSYRLKQIDNDGQYEYSKVINVDFNEVIKFELISEFSKSI